MSEKDKILDPPLHELSAEAHLTHSSQAMQAPLASAPDISTRMFTSEEIGEIIRTATLMQLAETDATSDIQDWPREEIDQQTLMKIAEELGITAEAINRTLSIRLLSREQMRSDRQRLDCKVPNRIRAKETWEYMKAALAQIFPDKEFEARILELHGGHYIPALDIYEVSTTRKPNPRAGRRKWSLFKKHPRFIETHTEKKCIRIIFYKPQWENSVDECFIYSPIFTKLFGDYFKTLGFKLTAGYET